MIYIAIFKPASLRSPVRDVSKGAGFESLIGVFRTLRDAPSGLLRDTENTYELSMVESSARNRGFTLIEVTIALAILAASLVTLLAGINAGVIFSDRDRDFSIASFLAQEKVTELERDSTLIVDGYDKSDQFEDEFERFSWSVKIAPDETAKAWADYAGIPFEPLKATVTISWKRGSADQYYVLEEMFFPSVLTTTRSGS